MKKNRINYLVQKFRRNQATAQEKDELEAFWTLAQNDGALSETLTSEEKASIRILMLQRIKSRISLIQGRRKRAHETMPAGGWILRIAACIAFLVAVSVVWVQYSFRDGVQEFRTNYGELKTISLPDGSTVVMNGNSTLWYDASWSANKDREVWIEGEGFFDVTHTLNDLKFVVHAEDDMQVRVLGTKFNVRSRRLKSEVMLEEGKVMLEVAGSVSRDILMLEPGELVTLEDNKLSRAKVTPLQYASWKERKLFFDQTPLRVVAETLEDTYGLEVIFNEQALANRKLSGEIASGKVADILTAIGESLNICVIKEGMRVVFTTKDKLS